MKQTAEQKYQMKQKALFYDKLIGRIQETSTLADHDSEQHLIKTVHNTQLFANALLQAFGDVGQVVPVMLMAGTCDFGDPTLLPTNKK